MSVKAHLEQIQKSIDDPAPYLVFADWLQERDDPWGRLIVLQHELEQRPGDGAIAAEVEALLKKQGWAPKAKPKLLRLDWRWGFIRSVRVYDELGHEDVEKVLGPVLELPMAALIQSCVVFRHERNRQAEKRLARKLPPGAALELIEPVILAQDEEPDRGARWVAVQGEVPADIGRFERLTFLSCAGIASLPREVGALPLERLDIDWCHELGSIPDEVWGIESLGYISMYDCVGLGLSMGQVNNLLLGFTRARTPRRQRVLEAALLQGGSPTASTEQLLCALDNNVKAVRTRALELLEKQLESPLAERPVERGSVVALLGSVNVDTKTLKARIEALGGKLTTRVATQTSHVLLGERPQGKQHDLRGLPLLLERHLVEMARGKTARGKTAGGALPLAQLGRDLRSRSDAKIQGAVRSLEQSGGVPEEILPELFLVTQDASLEKLGKGRKLAKKLFAAFAPARLRSAVGRHMKTSVLLAGETKQAERLAALAREAGDQIDMRRLARLVLEDFSGGGGPDTLGSGCGFKYILSRGEAVEIQWAVGVRIEGKRIDLSGLELDTLPDLSAFPALEEVDASNNHLTRFPVELRALPALRALDLSGNYLRSLPHSLAELASLRTLDLSCNRFQAFPGGVTTLPGLRELDLTSETWGATRITRVPKEIVSMKSLEVLKIENGRVAVELPEEISEMTWLRRLKVTWEGASNKPPAALRKLLPPGCRLS